VYSFFILSLDVFSWLKRWLAEKTGILFLLLLVLASGVAPNSIAVHAANNIIIEPVANKQFKI
jgi:hypothetical protein